MPSYPCIAAARRFDRSAHLPWVVGAERVGWIRRSDVRVLERWPAVFEIDSAAVRLNAALHDCAARSEALAEVIAELAQTGHIKGWRGETFAVRNRFDDAPLALIERAASRFFGSMTYAVHVNGMLFADTLTPRHDGPALWIARRSAAKPTDPGMLDSLVGGGIGWGYGIGETLIKESWEESGIPAELAAQATRGRVAHVLSSIEQGTQEELLYIYDLVLPTDFAPVAQDQEVAEHRIAGIPELLQIIAAQAMTVDASIATLDCLARRGWLAADACAALNTLFQAPRVTLALAS
ncbi:MAG: DUF4743 domain-containing protein [Janthinobacterium lividum]